MTSSEKNKAWDLSEFCKTGFITGNIGIGSSLEAFLLAAGTENYFLQALDEYDYYRYGPFVVSIWDHQIIGVNVVMNDDIVAIGSAKTNRIHRRTGISRLVQLLDDGNIKWKFDQKLTFDFQMCIVTQGGVSFIFGKNEPGVMLGKIASHILS